MPLVLTSTHGGHVVELFPINHAFWARYRRRKAALMAWRRYILQLRLEALRGAPRYACDQEWDGKHGRYL